MKHTTVHASQARMLLVAELTSRWRLTWFVIYHIAACVCVWMTSRGSNSIFNKMRN